MPTPAPFAVARHRHARLLKRSLTNNWQLYLLICVPLAYIIVFAYVPMYGLQIAFKDFQMNLGYGGSAWVGLKHFEGFVTSPYFPRLMANTIGISFYSIVAGLVPPIALAICLNECRNAFLKKSVQLITYAPHFLSTVIIVGIINQVFSSTGFVGVALGALGIDASNLLGNSKLFKSLYVWSGVWQSAGYNSIMYLAALSGIGPELVEAARIDGANVWKRIYHVDLPGILPTAVILLILSTAGILNVGFEKVYLMQNALNMPTSDVISTYTYRVGMVDMDYSFATAVGMFQSVISMIFMFVVNAIAKRTTQSSLW